LYAQKYTLFPEQRKNQLIIFFRLHPKARCGVHLHAFKPTPLLPLARAIPAPYPLLLFGCSVFVNIGESVGGERHGVRFTLFFKGIVMSFKKYSGALWALFQKTILPA
jgi:hypothetical protein